MISYLFQPAPGTALTNEPALFAILIVFVFTTILGAVLSLFSRRFRHVDPLASRQLRRLGNWLLGVGLADLVVALFFSQNALFQQRFWLYLGLAAVYAVIGYAVYFYLTQYPALAEEQRRLRERRKVYVPAPHTLGRSASSASRRSQERRRRRR